MIQKTWHLDSIVARALLVTDFIDSIDPKADKAGFDGGGQEVSRLKEMAYVKGPPTGLNGACIREAIAKARTEQKDDAASNNLSHAISLRPTGQRMGMAGGPGVKSRE